jgi:DNA-binding beta-propeller fold protein YncE
MQHVHRISALVALALAVGCASAPAPRVEVRWPPEPDPARIRFDRTIISGADVEASSWTSFQRTLFGTSPVGIVQPTSLAMSPDGSRLFMTDQTSGQVLWFDFKLKQAEVFAPVFAFSQPFGLALDSEGNVYVSEPAARRVRAFTRDGRLIREFGREAERPTGLAIDPKRQLIYVADGSSGASQNHRVLVYSLAGKLLRTIGTRGSEPGQFNFPSYLAVGADGQLFVTDTLNFRIQVFDPEGTLIRFFGEAGEALGTFSRPKGVALDKRGIVYVVDSGAARVQMFDDQNRLLMAFGGAAALLEYFERPAPIAIDPAGRYIYVGEQSAQFPRINVYEFLEAAEPVSAPVAPTGPVQPDPTAPPTQPVTPETPPAR